MSDMYGGSDTFFNIEDEKNSRNMNTVFRDMNTGLFIFLVVISTFFIFIFSVVNMNINIHIQNCEYGFIRICIHRTIIMNILCIYIYEYEYTHHSLDISSTL